MMFESDGAPICTVGKVSFAHMHPLAKCGIFERCMGKDGSGGTPERIFVLNGLIGWLIDYFTLSREISG